MMSFFTRVWSLLSTGSDGAAPTVEVVPGPARDQQAVAHIRQMEYVVARQREQLDRAVSLLQRSAFLARYHQPSLERDIRSLVADMNAERNDVNAASDRTAARPDWTVAASAGRFTA